MGEPQFVVDFHGYRLAALDVAKVIIELACYGNQQITMRYIDNACSDAGHTGQTDRIEFYEAHNPGILIGVIKNFAS